MYAQGKNLYYGYIFSSFHSFSTSSLPKHTGCLTVCSPSCAKHSCSHTRVRASSQSPLCNKNTGNALSPMALRSSTTCNVPTISVQTLGQMLPHILITSNGITLKFKCKFSLNSTDPIIFNASFKCGFQVCANIFFVNDHSRFYSTLLETTL